MICDRCKEDFPEHLVQPLTFLGLKVNVCGVCALEAFQKVQPDYVFHGTRARVIYEETKRIKEGRR